jgi:hypothetical protein
VAVFVLEFMHTKLHLGFFRLVFTRSRTIAGEDETRVNRIPKGSCSAINARTRLLGASVWSLGRALDRTCQARNGRPPTAAPKRPFEFGRKPELANTHRALLAWPRPRDERHCRLRPANIAAQARHISPPIPPVERHAAHVTTRRAPTHRTPPARRAPTYRAARIAHAHDERNHPPRPAPDEPPAAHHLRPDAPTRLQTVPRHYPPRPLPAIAGRVGRSLVPLPSVWRWC